LSPYFDLDDVASIRDYATRCRDKGQSDEDVKSVIRKRWASEGKKGLVEPEIYATIDEVFREARGMSIDRAKRTKGAFVKFAEYFDPKTPSRAADRLGASFSFLAINAPGASVSRLPLYSFNDFYKPDGETRIASELERIREKMLAKAAAIHRELDPLVKAEIERLKGEITDKREFDAITNELRDFLALPGSLEIKNSFREEITSSLAARNIKNPSDLNMQPAGWICRIALRDCTLETRYVGRHLIASLRPFNPDHYLTFALNVSLLNDEIRKEACEWWDFSVSVFGTEGARRFYEHVGYIMVTRYPQPTERTIHQIVGNPGTGKGTHLAAVESMLTFGPLTMFAKASPHKLTNPKEHFGKQNLQNKLAIIHSDIPHKKIRDFSEVNDLFGGEPFELEMKFKNPINEIPIFKGIFAMTRPLYNINNPGGAWRRILITQTRSVSVESRDPGIKPRLLSKLDGFFLNCLIGLSYLVANGWKFTGELSDSVGAWAENRLTPEDAEIEVDEVVSNTLDGQKKQTVKRENTDKINIIDELYEHYAEECTRQQSEPVKPKTFTAWLRDSGYEIKRRLIQEGKFRGQKKYVVFASFDPFPEDEEDPKTNRSQSEISWEAYIKGSPLTFDAGTDSHGQLLLKDTRRDDVVKSDHYGRELPPWIGLDQKGVQKGSIKRSGENQNWDRSVSETSSDDERIIFKRVTSVDPKLNLDPVRYPDGLYFKVTAKDGHKIKAYLFSIDVSEREFDIMTEEDDPEA
jgi:phage/plasmid-associated DNA primase